MFYYFLQSVDILVFFNLFPTDNWRCLLENNCLAFLHSFPPKTAFIGSPTHHQCRVYKVREKFPLKRVYEQGNTRSLHTHTQSHLLYLICLWHLWRGLIHCAAVDKLICHSFQGYLIFVVATTTMLSPTLTPSLPLSVYIWIHLLAFISFRYVSLLHFCCFLFFYWTRLIIIQIFYLDDAHAFRSVHPTMCLSPLYSFIPSIFQWGDNTHSHTHRHAILLVRSTFGFRFGLGFLFFMFLIFGRFCV